MSFFMNKSFFFCERQAPDSACRERNFSEYKTFYAQVLIVVNSIDLSPVVASFAFYSFRRFLVETEGSGVDRKVRETFHLDPISSKSVHSKSENEQNRKRLNDY